MGELFLHGEIPQKTVEPIELVETVETEKLFLPGFTSSEKVISTVSIWLQVLPDIQFRQVRQKFRQSDPKFDRTAVEISRNNPLTFPTYMTL